MFFRYSQRKTEKVRETKVEVLKKLPRRGKMIYSHLRPEKAIFPVLKGGKRKREKKKKKNGKKEEKEKENTKHRVIV